MNGALDDGEAWLSMMRGCQYESPVEDMANVNDAYNVRATYMIAGDNACLALATTINTPLLGPLRYISSSLSLSLSHCRSIFYSLFISNFSHQFLFLSSGTSSKPLPPRCLTKRYSFSSPLLRN